MQKTIRILGKMFYILSIGLCSVSAIILLTPTRTPLGDFLFLSERGTFYFCLLVQCIFIGGLLGSCLYTVLSVKTDIGKYFLRLKDVRNKRILWILGKMLFILGIVLLLYISIVSFAKNWTPLDFTILPPYLIAWFWLEVMGLPPHGDTSMMIVDYLFLLQWFIIGGLIGLWLYKKDHPRNLGKEKNLTPN
mgnify:CR=1 FL=1